MTKSSTLLSDQDKSSVSFKEIALSSPLADAIAQHNHAEIASFHTPGHKGKSLTNTPTAQQSWETDLTELPGFDELARPTGILANLEHRAARLWGAQESIISINGASAPIMASMLAVKSAKSKILVPTNAHRSVLQGLVLSGLFPIWYEPLWDNNWGLWGPIAKDSIAKLLKEHGSALTALMVTSPTYAGATSDIATLADLCHAHKIPLIVDEAHGAHFLSGTNMPTSALQSGADIVVHSLHKTLSSLTQTGLLHVGKNSLIDPQNLRRCLNLLQSSSPSYLFLCSIEQTIAQLENAEGKQLINQLNDWSKNLADNLPSIVEIYKASTGNSPLHVLIKSDHSTAQDLYNHLTKQGIFPECVLGNGVLLLLGMGSSSADLKTLQKALEVPMRAEMPCPTAHDKSPIPEGKATHGVAPTLVPANSCSTLNHKPIEIEQILSPRDAFMAPSQVVPAADAIGRISSDIIAPCPPGTPLLVPGQRISSSILEIASIQKLRVIVE